MPTPLEKIQAGADKARAKLAAKGLSEHQVTLRTPAVSDPITGRPGAGAPVDLVLEPPPRIRQASMRRVEQSGGLVQAGDLVLRGVTRASAFEALVLATETIWVVEGPAYTGEYTSVGAVTTMRPAEWEVVLTRRP